MMSMKFAIIGVVFLFSHSTSFLLDEIEMDEDTLEACSTCDARADRAGNFAVAEALRKYMTKNHIKLIINEGDGVQVTKSLPNQKIETGHSCSKTAEARGITVSSKMTNKNNALDSLNIDYDKTSWNTFLEGDVPHEVTVKADVRVKFGSKIWFGKCNTVGRKTCEVTGSSTGMNIIYVNLAASDYSVITHPNGEKKLYLNLGIGIFEGGLKPETYSPFKASSSCSILGGLVTINGLVQKYGGQYINDVKDTINEIRGPALIRRLETLLREKFGKTVEIPIKVVGPPTRGRKKRAAQNGCQRMKCPSAFTKLGNTKKCQKFFRSSKPNCIVYGNGASLYQRNIGSRTYYWCHINMVPQ